MSSRMALLHDATLDNWTITCFPNFRVYPFSLVFNVLA